MSIKKALKSQFPVQNATQQSTLKGCVISVQIEKEKHTRR